MQKLCRACSPKVCCINHGQGPHRFPQLSSPPKIQQIYPKTLETGHGSEAFSLKGLLLISNHIAIKPPKKDLCFNQQFQPKHPYLFKYARLLIPFCIYKKGVKKSPGKLGSTNCIKEFSLHCINEMHVVLIFILLLKLKFLPILILPFTL